LPFLQAQWTMALMMRCLTRHIMLTARRGRRIVADQESEQPRMRAIGRPDVLDDSDSTKQIGLAVRLPAH
jgi:hypothetical protein